MCLNEWSGRKKAATMRQWSALVALSGRAAAIESLDGLVLLGSFASGEPDELSDIDVLAVAKSGRFAEAWNERHRLSRDALACWDLGPGSDCRGHNWLTRDIVRLDCTIVDPASGGRELAAPYIVCVGPREIADRFPPVALQVVRQRWRQIADEQDRLPVDPDALAYGELIDWKISEFKNAVRRAPSTVIAARLRRRARS